MNNIFINCNFCSCAYLFIFGWSGRNHVSDAVASLGEGAGGRRGGADRPGWHHPGGYIRIKKLWLNLQRTLDSTMSEDGSCGVVMRLQ